MGGKILIIGSGAREHAILKSLSNSRAENELFCVGTNLNPGISQICKEIVIKDINNTSLITRYAKDRKISLAIVGPENPLEAGISNELLDIGIQVIGPKKELAQIETSKTFTRNLLNEYNIPGGPKYKSFKSLVGASEFLEHLGDDYVVKYDGLAGGKGVKVSGEHLLSKEDALQYCHEIVKKGGSFLIEEKFIGEEFSLMSFSDGVSLKHMPLVQDHKRADENDLGPNTGGMGTYTDVNHSLPFLNDDDIATARMINEKTAEALKDRFNEGYKGILYGGFIATKAGVKLIEYNARFGDPEAMNVLSILKTDFVDICNAIIDEKLSVTEVEFENIATVCKYAVPEGYPEKPTKGERIDVSSVNNMENLFFASVGVNDGELIEEGSRTVACVGKGSSIHEAERIAEKEISCVKGPLFHREDIGTRKLIKKRIAHLESLR